MGDTRPGDESDLRSSVHVGHVATLRGKSDASPLVLVQRANTFAIAMVYAAPAPPVLNGAIWGVWIRTLYVTAFMQPHADAGHETRDNRWRFVAPGTLTGGTALD